MGRLTLHKCKLIYRHS